MRLLFVSYFFPPFNTIGAVRVGKTAAYLSRWGHDVRVLTVADAPLQPTLPVELDESRITRTSWLNVNAPVEWALGGRQRVAAQGFATAGKRRSLMSHLGRWYKTLLNLPDGQIGWLPRGVEAGSKLLRNWQPDLIVASAMPPTSLLIAQRLAERFNIPWVAELRDLWVDEGSYRQPAWRRTLEKRWERTVLSSAAGMVTVSEPLADTLREQYGKPTTVVLNGFDADDFRQAEQTPVEPQLRDESTLNIAYTGMIYAGRRDPTPLFQALAQLGPLAEQVRVNFFGRYLQPVVEQAARLGVSRLVRVHDAIAYHESLAVQQQSDVLLLLVDADPQQRGVFTGKVFEYFGARRPILALGPTDNVASQLILDRAAGAVLQEPGAIAEHLRSWLRQKQLGTLSNLPTQQLVGLSRSEQVRHFERFLLERCPTKQSMNRAA